MSIETDLLEIEYETPGERLARILSENDADLLLDLVAMREAAGLTQAELAAKLGVTQATISAFERYDNDPKLSTIRRYAMGVGTVVCHSVEIDRSGQSGYENWAGRGMVRLSARASSGPLRTTWHEAS